MCRDCNWSLINPDSAGTLSAVWLLPSQLSESGLRITHKNEGKARDHKKAEERYLRGVCHLITPWVITQPVR